VDPFLAAAATAFGVVFLAELGDKSQILLLAQAARAPRLRVLVEAVAAFALLTALAVTVGALLATFVPQPVLLIASGLIFLVFAAMAGRQATSSEVTEEKPLRIGGTFALVVVSEMGDKTQLATAALAAASGQAIATGVGSWLAESSSALLAVLLGAWLARHVETRRRAAISAILFLVLGIGIVIVALGDMARYL
jgi:putative Ca2+/H+ antiporter (TMEM165/GDT1 family)